MANIARVNPHGSHNTQISYHRGCTMCVFVQLRTSLASIEKCNFCTVYSQGMITNDLQNKMYIRCLYGAKELFVLLYAYPFKSLDGCTIFGLQTVMKCSIWY